MHILRPVDITPAMVTSTNVPVNDFAVWNAATNYTAGTKVIRTTTNRIYRSITGGTFATLPENDTVHWMDEGYVNAYKMIDAISSTQTSQANSIVFTVNLGQKISSLSFINLVGEELRIFATDNGAATIYDKTISLDATQVTSYYDWFLEPFVQKPDHVELDFPEVVSQPIITITLSGAGTVKMGRFVCAKSYQIGYMQYGAGISIKDYSVKTTDVNNIVSLTKKDNVKLMTFRLELFQAETNRINKLLRELLSVPCVFVGISLDTYEYTIAHGFFQTFRVVLAFRGLNYCELDIEELT